MSIIHTTTNAGKRLDRQLGRAFSAKAVGTADPNTLHSNVPVEADAMGISDNSGLVTLTHLEVAAVTVTVYYWNQIVKNFNAAKGWVLAGHDNTEYQQAVDPGAGATFKVPPNTPFFIKGSAVCTDLFVGGSRFHPANATPDLQTMVTG